MGHWKNTNFKGSAIICVALAVKTEVISNGLTFNINCCTLA
jgi:hypothetical protein